MTIKTIYNTKLIRNKHFWIMIIFWMLVGASSRAFYDLQLLFEGIFGSASKTNFIVAGAGVFAAIIGAPIVGILVDKFRRYKVTVTITILFMIIALLLLPILSSGGSQNMSYYLVLGIATPLVGIGYSYRSILDPFSTAYTETNSLPATITRGFYSVGAGLFSVVILTLIKYSSKNNFSIQTMYYIIICYVAMLVLLLVFIAWKMKEPIHISQTHVKRKGIDWLDLKTTFKNKVFWFGLIALFFLIGMSESMSSVEKHTAVQNSKLWGNEHDVVMYIDLLKMVPETVFFIITSLIFMRFGIKKSGIMASVVFIFGSGILAVSTYFNIKWLFIIATSIVTPFIASLSLGLGYEFVTSRSDFSIRGIAGTIFNAVTYGFGGVLFFLVNGPLFDADLGYVVYIGYSVLAIIPLILFIFFIPNIQTKVKLSNKKAAKQ